MNCPICRNVSLTEIEIDGIKVMHCKECDGIFLHEGELKNITHPTEGDIEYSSIEEADLTKKSGIPCPLCNSGEVSSCQSCCCSDNNCSNSIPFEMIDINFASFSNVKMQYCPTCKGIWLGGGTLDLINKEIDKLNHDKDSWEYILAAFLAKLPF